MAPVQGGGLLEEYRYLTEHVSMWDVAVERQIQIKGPDAAAFVDMLITRDVHSLLRPMQARYVILCNQYGGLINDPVLLRVAEDEFWFSISDSDVLLWAQGVNSSGRFDVDIHEIDVSPVQIQGPKSAPLMEKMFGSHVREIPYYHLIHDELNGHANVGSNIALAIMPPSHWKRGTRVKVQLPKDGLVDAEVVPVPFFDPTKERPKSEL